MIPHPSTIGDVAAIRRKDLLAHAERQRIAAVADDRIPDAPCARGVGATCVQAVAALWTSCGVATFRLDPPRAAARGGRDL